MNCPLCGCEKTAVKHRFTSPPGLMESFAIASCNECGHLFTSPFPSDELLATLYTSGPFLDVLASIVREDMDQFVQDRQWEIVQRFTRGGALLDVGCGAGTFLRRASEYGYRGVGLEKFSPLVEFVRNETNLEVHEGTLEDNDIADDSADAATLWDVFEHLPDPNTSLKALGRILKPGGHLFFGVPNAECLETEVFGCHWAGWWVPLHLHHYSPAKVEELLRKHGFRAVYRSFHQEPYITAESLHRLMGADTSALGAFVGRGGLGTAFAKSLLRLTPLSARKMDNLCIRSFLNYTAPPARAEKRTYLLLAAVLERKR